MGLSARAALFVLEVPTSEAPNAPHVIELKWVDAKGEGSTLQLHDGASSARLPSIAQNGASHLVAFTAERTVKLVEVACE